MQNWFWLSNLISECLHTLLISTTIFIKFLLLDKKWQWLQYCNIHLFLLWLGGITHMSLCICHIEMGVWAYIFDLLLNYILLLHERRSKSLGVMLSSDIKQQTFALLVTDSKAVWCLMCVITFLCQWLVKSKNSTLARKVIE